MSSSRGWDWEEIAVTTSVVSITSGVGAGVGAAIRGGSITESSSVAASGTALLTIGFGLFSKPNDIKLSHTQAMLGFAFFELAGSAVGYAGAKLVLKAATSTLPILDTALGYPVTAGLFFCAGVAAQYFEQERKNELSSAPKLHTR